VEEEQGWQASKLGAAHAATAVAGTARRRSKGRRRRAASEQVQ